MTEFLEFLSSISPILVWLLVCFAKIVEITVQSLKTVLMVKGQSLRAAALGLLECMIWGLAISTIIGTLGNDFYLLAFTAWVTQPVFTLVPHWKEKLRLVPRILNCLPMMKAPKRSLLT